ncbi:MAG: hypothetical protein AB7U23_10040 [Dehalococcoidia bacterium]
MPYQAVVECDHPECGAQSIGSVNAIAYCGQHIEWAMDAALAPVQQLGALVAQLNGGRPHA